MKEYTDKEINNMILFLRVNRFAEFQYIDSTSDLKFYDYMTDTHSTRDDIVKLAKENKWTPDWQKGD